MVQVVVSQVCGVVSAGLGGVVSIFAGVDFSQVPWLLILGLSVALAAGAFVQAVVGFGVALVASPFVLFYAPELMPISVLICGLTLPLIQVAAGPYRFDWSLIRVALCARVLLTPVGALVVVFASRSVIAVLVSVLILVSVAVVLRAPVIRPSRRNSFIAGALTGVTGTAASIGGPFVALTMRGRDADVVRSTLAVFFSVGAAVSLLALAVSGTSTTAQWVAGVCWIPAVLVGFLLAQPLKPRINAVLFQKFTLLLCVLACPVVIIRALLSS